MFEPEDIFAGVEPAKPEPLRPRGAVSPTVPGRPGAPAPVGAMPPTKEELGEAPAPRKKVFLVMIAVALLAILGVGGYLVWQQFASKTVTEVIPLIRAPENINVNAPAVNAPSVASPPALVCGNGICETGEDSTTCPADCPLPSPAIVDTDLDRLLDSEEAALGTDPNKVDTDDDGLTDREEVQIYATDPLNPDTDGDTYEDGDEVKAGYDPRGPGRLFELPR
jgi:hypothetical protein